MPLSRRAQRHEQTRQEIKQIARQQIARQGTAAALSIRGIAAEMGISAPSLYNYYTSRDDLLTDLIADSYTHQAEALERASASCSTQNPLQCLLTTLLAYRQWALNHTMEFALLSGTPTPGYAAPVDQTLPLARRSLKVVLDLLQRAWDDHRVETLWGSIAFTTAPLDDELDRWRQEQGYALPVVALFLDCYAFLQGFLALELFGHMPFFISDPGSFYRAALLMRLGAHEPGAEPAHPNAS